MRPLTELTAAIREAGGKITPQRQLIFEMLEGNETHPSAESLYEKIRVRMPTVSLTTVYKTLNELVAMGELKRFDINGVSHFDPNTDPHAEAVCLGCQRIVDVSHTIPETVGSPAGFRVTTATLTFYGWCAECGYGRVSGSGHDEV